MISANEGANTLTVLTNNGSGGFGFNATVAVGGGPWCIIAADVNGDGKPDLISANQAANSLTVLTNNGSGGFGLVAHLPVGATPRSVAAVDVNGDGKLDLVSANTGAPLATVLTNNGSGGFSFAYFVGVGVGTESIISADVNGDGRPDLIGATADSSTVIVLTNNGVGNYVWSATLGVGNHPTSVIAADVNGDGKVDLISANLYANTLTVLTNNGSGVFVLASSPGVGSQSCSVAAADINGDGHLDLISANYGANSLTVLANIPASYQGNFTGSGAGLSGLNASQVTSGTLPLAQLPGAVVTNNASGVALTGTFTGNGAAVTNVNADQLDGQHGAFYLNAANLNAGTLADGRLSANVPLLSAHQVFTGSNRFAGVVTLTNATNLIVGSFSGNGNGLTNVNADQLDGQQGTYYLNAANLNAGTLADGRLSANVALLNAHQAFTGSNRFAGVVALTNAANTLAGNGGGITNVNADQLDGQQNTYYQNAGNLNAGTLADGRLSANVALLGANQAFTASNRFAGVVTATNTANTFVGAFTGNAAGLTNLDAADLAGTVPDARLSANVALLNTNQVFTGSNRFAGMVTLTNVANTLAGNGGGITNVNADQLDGQQGMYYLNAGNLNAGTLADGRLSANVAKLNANQTFTATNNFTGKNGFGVTDPGYVLDAGDRIRLRPGAGGTAGLWLQGSDDINDAFVGLLDDGHIGVWGKEAGWGLVMNRTNAHVGIGVSAPAYPLTFANVLGDKISLYGNAGSHYGFGIQGSLLQIYSGGASADIAFGYGESTNLTENVRFKGNGNVGIGTSTPATKLDVAGMASADSLNVRGGGRLSAPLDVVTRGWTLDQEQDASNALTYWSGALWQSFTAGTTGLLAGVSLYYGANDGVSDWIATLSIYDGEGVGGTVLSRQTVTGDGEVRVRMFSLEAPVALTNGHQYTICIDSDIVCQWKAATGNPYAGGTCNYSTTHSTDWDQWFRTYMDAGTFTTPLYVQPGTGYIGVGRTDPGHVIHTAGGAYCTAAGSWVSNSDRNAKEQFTAINPSDVLAKVAALPITQWKYKAEPDGVKHLGPMAQDFHATFGLGDSDKAIGTVDESGVALAAIQGLNQKVESRSQESEVRSRKLEDTMKEKDAEIQALKASVAELQEAVRRLTSTAK